MPDIINLLKKDTEKKKFQKSSYRPWNFMDQIEKEDETKLRKIDKEQTEISTEIVQQTNTKTTIPMKYEKVVVVAVDNIESNVDKIFKLSGYQKSLFEFIIEICLSRGMLNSGPVNNSVIVKLLKTSSNMVKTTVCRLIQKNLILRKKGKSGRGGFYDFSISESVRAAALEYRRLLNNTGPMFDKKTPEENYTSMNNPIVRNHEWQHIDIEPLKEIGFTVDHLNQISSQFRLLPKIAQDSIDAFAFDLKENDKKKKINGDPISFFMGILRKDGIYLPPGNYESPQARCMRLYEERMSEIEAKNTEIEKKAFELAFRDWFKQLTDIQKIEFLPENLRSNPRLENNKILEGGARGYFEKKVWLDIKNQILHQL